MPETITSIEESAFQNCRSLINITIPNNVSFIGAKSFSGCTSLTSVVINNRPGGNNSIGNYAFGNCISLTSVTIPGSVSRIGNYAFYRCSGLTSITVDRTTPPTMGGLNAFDNTNNCPIYVPAESVDTYKNTYGWSNYASRIRAIP